MINFLSAEYFKTKTVLTQQGKRIDHFLTILQNRE